MQKLPVIFLIGPRGSGKTSIGRLLADALGRRLFDTDCMVTEDAGCCVADIVTREGWASFRQRESQALLAASLPGCVVSTGGGMILSPENCAVMRAKGLVFYLSASPECLYTRLAGNLNPGQRPSLTGADPLDEIKTVLRERENLYLAASHHTLDASLAPDLIVESILRIIGTGSV